MEQFEMASGANRKQAVAERACDKFEILINNTGSNAKDNASEAPAEIDVEDFVANYCADLQGAVQLRQWCVPQMAANIELLIAGRSEHFGQGPKAVMSNGSRSAYPGWP